MNYHKTITLICANLLFCIFCGGFYVQSASANETSTVDSYWVKHIKIQTSNMWYEYPNPNGCIISGRPYYVYLNEYVLAIDEIPSVDRLVKDLLYYPIPDTVYAYGKRYNADSHFFYTILSKMIGDKRPPLSYEEHRLLNQCKNIWYKHKNPYRRKMFESEYTYMLDTYFDLRKIPFTNKQLTFWFDDPAQGYQTAIWNEDYYKKLNTNMRSHTLTDTDKSAIRVLTDIAAYLAIIADFDSKTKLLPIEKATYAHIVISLKKLGINMNADSKIDLVLSDTEKNIYLRDGKHYEFIVHYMGLEQPPEYQDIRTKLLNNEKLTPIEYLTVCITVEYLNFLDKDLKELITKFKGK